MTCTFPACERAAYAKGLCPSHYRMQRLGEPLRPLTPYQRCKGLACTGPGCSRPAKSQGLCLAHWQQRAAGIELRTVLPRGASAVERYATHAEILLLDRAGQVKARATVDLADAALVEGYRWRTSRSRNGRKDYVLSHAAGLLHRFLMDAPEELEVDHINGDPLDNRRGNLRLVTHAENCQNVAQSGREHLRGVHLTRHGTYMAYAVRQKRMFFTCGLATEEQAREEAQRLREALMTHNVEERHL